MLLGTAQTNTAAKTFNNATLLLRNVADTFSSWFTNAATAARTWTLPNKDGTVAMTSDITGTNSNTNTGDQTSIVGITGTIAQFNTACTDEDFVGKATSDELTNKRITMRMDGSTSTATPTINTDTCDIFRLLSQTDAITSFTTNLSGTPRPGDVIVIEVKGTGAIAITWGAKFEASTVALPTTTVAGALLTTAFMWNDATSKWRCVAVV
jgi:hypothetical protein